MLISLDDVPKHTEMEVGLKAWNLSKVKGTGVRVPFTVIIPSDVISQLMSESGIRHDIFKLSRIVMDSNSPEKAFELEKEVRSKINSLSIPEDLLDGIMDSIAGNVEKMIVARPSPYASELVDGDLKGRMGVWYDEPTKKGIVRSIQRVLGDSFSLKAIARMMDLGVYPEDLDLAIMIQKVIFPRSSGIAICCPARRRNEILVESTWGSMNGVPKDRFRISMDLMEVVESELSEKKVKLVPSPQGIREVEVPHHLWMEPSVKGGEIEVIARTSADLSLILGTPTLMEWVIQEGTDVLFVIQAHKEPERPPVKPLERKVINWLEERREVREIKEERSKEVKKAEPLTRPGKVAPREVEISPVALVASKIYVRYPAELPRGLVDGWIVEVDELSGLGLGDHIVILRDP
ncbi:MAG: PEP/pyruvate-binding domain-containing protein, partial [Candidatus Korarchaeota archaeon]|nr:PEP/pyruvate-binding domain-containing protein [Candidatus Korarchaeota archaeon]